MNCYNCSIPLVGDAVSVEHVIPQSIGGRLKSKLLLCSRCNSTFGSSIDKAVEICYESIVALLSIERERSDGLPVLKNLPTPSGNLYRLVDGKRAEVMHPSVIKTEEGYTITPRNEAQFKDILKGFKKKYPSLNIDEALQAMTYVDTYLHEPLRISFTLGGEPMLRGVAKMAINRFIQKFGNAHFLDHIIQVANGSHPLEQVVHLVPTDYHHQEADEVSHTIYLKSLPESKILYAWVNLFCFSSFIVVLSNQYDGPAIEDTFSYDLFLMAERVKKVEFEYKGPHEYSAQTLSEQQQLVISQSIQETVSTGIRQVINISRRIRFNKGLMEIYDQAFADELKGKSATHFTEDMLEAVMRKFWERATPFIADFMAKGKSETLGNYPSAFGRVVKKENSDGF